MEMTEIKVSFMKNPYIIEHIIILLVGESDENERCLHFEMAAKYAIEIGGIELRRNDYEKTYCKHICNA